MDKSNKLSLTSSDVEEERSNKQGEEYTKLCCGTENHQFRVRKQRSKVNHRTDTDKENKRE